MGHYTVQWSIDVEAANVIDAALAARGAQYPGTSAIVFDVLAPSGILLACVDLEQHGGDPLANDYKEN